LCGSLPLAAVPWGAAVVDVRRGRVVMVLAF
jgi:hypothetical protein